MAKKVIERMEANLDAWKDTLNLAAEEKFDPRFIKEMNIVVKMISRLIQHAYRG